MEEDLLADSILRQSAPSITRQGTVRVELVEVEQAVLRRELSVLAEPQTLAVEVEQAGSAVTTSPLLLVALVDPELSSSAISRGRR